MTSEERMTLWEDACRHLFADFYPGSSVMGKRLDSILGVRYYKDWLISFDWLASNEQPLPEEIKRLLKLLAGPHGKAVLKAYRIRKGLDK